MSRPASQPGAKAQIDFHCFSPECDGVVKFNLADIAGRDFQAVCPKCHRSYALDSGLKDKLGRMLELIIAIRQQARANKDWATADQIRDELKKLGIVLEDGADAVHWKLAD